MILDEAAGGGVLSANLRTGGKRSERKGRDENLEEGRKDDGFDFVVVLNM